MCILFIYFMLQKKIVYCLETFLENVENSFEKSDKK